MIPKRIQISLGLAAAILGLSLGLSFLDNTALLSENGANRIMQIAIGLLLAGYGNFMPKDIENTGSSPRAFTAVRVGGWALTIGGLIYAGLWAFAPYPVADAWSMISVGIAVLITLGYGAWCWMGGRSKTV